MRPILIIEDDPNHVLLVRETLADLNLVNDIADSDECEIGPRVRRAGCSGADYFGRVSAR